MRKSARFIALGWLLTVLWLFFYSFTQIDLGLTLTRASFWQPIQKAFQTIGYFNRPLSTAFYLLILFFLFLFYFLILKAVAKKWLSLKQLWLLILITAVLLWPAYNAFSYDLFNYIFDAKIITFYGLNPYQHKALDFPGDPMLGFMHWTHRFYPYGPAWLAFTVPLSFLGFQKLIPTALLIKALAVGSYLGVSWLILKILNQLNSSQKRLAVAIFAFNPLVIIESLVSAHNDILMMFLVLAAFWFLKQRKFLISWLIFFLSVGIKFATGLLLPVFLFISWLQLTPKKINWPKIWGLSLALMGAALVLAAWRIGEIKPWYWLYLLPLVSFFPEKKWLIGLSASLSAGFLLHYAPFFYFGNWDSPVPAAKLALTLTFLFLGIIFSLVLKLNHGKSHQKTGAV